MATTLETAMARGKLSVWLGVGRQNTRANRFYEKQGFAAVGTKTFRVGGQLFDKDIVRECPLSVDPSGQGDNRLVR